jgi:hypothetical protein
MIGEWCSRKDGRGEPHVMVRKWEEEMCNNFSNDFTIDIWNYGTNCLNTVSTV